MSKFKQFLFNKGFIENNIQLGINSNSKYATDSHWQDVWTDLLDYYMGNIGKASQAIDDAIFKHGKNAKNKILSMLASIKANGSTQRGVGIPES